MYFVPQTQSKTYLLKEFSRSAMKPSGRPSVKETNKQQQNPTPLKSSLFLKLIWDFPSFTLNPNLVISRVAPRYLWSISFWISLFNSSTFCCSFFLLCSGGRLLKSSGVAPCGHKQAWARARPWGQTQDACTTQPPDTGGAEVRVCFHDQEGSSFPGHPAET